MLVILGLLTGGILAGKSLIRASELRKVGADLIRYKTATYSFRDKYFGLPGDLPNATSFWGTKSGCAANSTTASTCAAACNGDGNGIISYSEGPYASGAGYSDGWFNFWNHLSCAGLIEGMYTGIGMPAAYNVLVGSNVPKGPFGTTGYMLYYSGNHLLHFGSASADKWVNGAALTPEEAWNIDTKMDDGNPNLGILQASGSATTAPICMSSTAINATFALDTQDTACGLNFFILK